MENVNEASSVAPLTGLLACLEGYKMEAGAQDPATDGGRAYVAGAALLAAHPRVIQPGMRLRAASGRTAVHEASGARHDAREGEMSGSGGTSAPARPRSSA
eukprot:7182200-Prymnesium_polylepis.1